MNEPADPKDFTLTDIIRRKEEARGERAQNLTFGQEVAIVERLREDLAPFRTIREQRKPRASTKSDPDAV